MIESPVYCVYKVKSQLQLFTIIIYNYYKNYLELSTFYIYFDIFRYLANFYLIQLVRLFNNTQRVSNKDPTRIQIFYYKNITVYIPLYSHTYFIQLTDWTTTFQTLPNFAKLYFTAWACLIFISETVNDVQQTVAGTLLVVNKYILALIWERILHIHLYLFDRHS